MSCSVAEKCSVCKPGYLLQNSHLQNSTCVLCSIDNCASCSSDNVCAQCSSGYSPNTNNGCDFCQSPCKACAVNGCSSCLSPFNPTPDVNGACFICNIVNCADCSADGTSCTTCQAGYDISVDNSNCTKTCPANCDDCVDSTSCTKCSKYYYINANNLCTQCLNTPKCEECTLNGCTKCASGYLSVANVCTPCPSYCAVCDPVGYCRVLKPEYATEHSLFELDTANTRLALCDPGCLKCSNINPKICITCADTFYRVVGPTFSAGVCFPCDPLSNCKNCDSRTPATCI